MTKVVVWENGVRYIRDAKQGDLPDTAAELAAKREAMSVSRFQAKEALRLAGLLDAANAAVTASGDATIQLAWAEAATFNRLSPSILALAPVLSLDDDQLDALFATAATITA